MDNHILISHSSKVVAGTIDLPGSKSESNRALIINALSGKKTKLYNLSNSDDTKILQGAITSDKTEINIENAGTAMRFLISFFVATKQDKILTGNPRMLERPIGPLVEALKTLGAKLECLDKPGFPPVKVIGSQSIFNKNKISISANISSQFISSLLMIAPVMPDGLEIELEGEISSRPYIDMTLGIMNHFGVRSNYNKNTIIVEHKNYSSSDFVIESDWSGAASWYVISTLSNDPAIFLKGLNRLSYQGDSIIKEWFKPFGIISEFTDNGVFITKGNEDLNSLPEMFDFTDYPDLAQAIIVLCAIKNIKTKFTGLESLRIKETDRIKALQNELRKFNVSLNEDTNGIFSIEGTFEKVDKSLIETYDDHRMAMAFAPLALVCDEIIIANPSCVNKSYPAFWDDLETVGFKGIEV